MLKNLMLLCTLNAQYIHSTLDCYLLANMSGLREQTRLIGSNVKDEPLQIAEQLLEINAK